MRASRAACTAPVWRARRPTTGSCAICRRCWTCPSAIDVYIGDTPEDVIGDDVWAETFTEQPAPLTVEEKRAWLDAVTGVSLGSDAFFPFGDNIERARRSGVTAIVEPGGSIRDEQVIETCDKYGIVMAFNGLRLFHH